MGHVRSSNSSSERNSPEILDGRTNVKPTMPTQASATAEQPATDDSQLDPLIASFAATACCEGVGTKAQHSACGTYSNERFGRAPDLSVTCTGQSGRHKRPALEDLLRAASAGKLDILIVEDFDRIGRSPFLVFEFIELFTATGAELHVASHGRVSKPVEVMQQKRRVRGRPH
jgi:hypothetical protein